MKNFAQKIKRFLKSEDGPTAVEYAVMLSLIIVICLGAVKQIGTNATSTFSAVANQISAPSAQFGFQFSLAIYGKRNICNASHIFFQKSLMAKKQLAFKYSKYLSGAMVDEPQVHFSEQHLHAPLKHDFRKCNLCRLFQGSFRNSRPESAIYSSVKV